VVGDGKVLVPNDFVVELGTHDHQRLSPWTKALTKELAAMVREHAAEQGYSFVGPVTVALEETQGVDTGVFRVRSGVTAGDVVDGGVLTKVGSPAADAKQAGPQGALPGNPRLVFSADGKAEADSPEGRGQERAYFLTQDDPHTFDETLNALLAAAGLPPETRRVPFAVAKFGGRA